MIRGLRTIFSADFKKPPTPDADNAAHPEGTERLIGFFQFLNDRQMLRTMLFTASAGDALGWKNRIPAHGDGLNKIPEAGSAALCG